MAAIDAVQGQKLLTSGENADFTIECRGKTWNVHKLIISTNSDHFAQLCRGNFREGKEAKAVLKDEDPDIVSRAINWMYTKQYIMPERTPPPKPDQAYQHKLREMQIKHHLDMYFFADRFFMDSLKEAAITQISQPFMMQVESHNGAGKTLQTVYENSRIGDTLRSKLVLIAANNLAATQLDELAVSVLSKNEPLAWSLCLKLRQLHDQLKQTRHQLEHARPRKKRRRVHVSEKMMRRTRTIQMNLIRGQRALDAM